MRVDQCEGSCSVWADDRISCSAHLTTGESCLVFSLRNEGTLMGFVLYRRYNGLWRGTGVQFAGHCDQVGDSSL